METATQRSRRQAGDAADAQGVRSIRRALDILSLLTDDTPVVSIRDITEATGLPKTTVLRLVHTLEQSGLLWATSGGYMAGPGLWRWAYLARRSWQLPPETQATMRDLGAKHQETVNLYVLRDIARVCIAQQESPRPLRHVVQVGDELPLWAGASSKILLSDAPETLLARVARRSPDGEKHLETLKQWAADARRDGYAVSHGERGRHLRGRRARHRPLRVGGRRARDERPHAPVHRGPGHGIRGRPQAGRRTHVRARVRPSPRPGHLTPGRRAPAGAHKEYLHARPTA